MAAQGVAQVATAPAAPRRCAAADTPRQCLAKLVTRANDAPATLAQADAAVKRTVAAMNSGAVGFASPVYSTMLDFMSVISTELGGSSVREKDDSLIFDYNMLEQWKFEVLLAKPRLSAQAINGFAGNAILQASTEGRLSNLDDVTPTLSYSVATTRLGRAAAPHRPLLAAIITTVGSEGTVPVSAEKIDTPFDRLYPDPTARETAIAAFEGAAQASEPAAGASLSSDFGLLLGNQPQLILSAFDHFRKDVVGPPEVGVALKLEIGSQNLNGFYRGEGRDCAPGNPRLEPAACLAAFRDYAKRTIHPNSAHRFAATVGIRRWRTMDLLLLPVPQQVQRGYLRVFEIGYGRPFASAITGKEGRIDLSVAFNGLTTNGTLTASGSSTPGSPTLWKRTLAATAREAQVLPAPYDRIVAAATYTQKLSDRWSVPLSLVYRNHREVLPGVPTLISPFLPPAPIRVNERGMSVRIGVSYKVPSANTPSPGDSCCCR